jgi:hypothetical protein
MSASARWRFAAEGYPAETDERARVRDAIGAWWVEFGRKTPDLEAQFTGKAEWDLPAWVNHHLGAIAPGLMWEFGPGVLTRHRLVITPESQRHLRPLVDEILRLAPRIPDWEFYPYRLAESYEMALATVEARTGGDLSRCLFVAQPGAGNLVDLTFFLPSFTDEDTDRGPLFVACETLLGEETLDTWIGQISVKKRGWLSRGQPLEALREGVEAAIRQIRSTLPDRPCFETSVDADWSLFELKPDALDDCPGQADMYVGGTMLPEMWKSVHGGAPFSSARFSRHGETFCYVKIDGSEGLEGTRFADRSEVEDALDEALVPERLGCHVGGGTGRRYSYVDLALTDLERGCEVVRRVLREGNITRRCWIQFFDDVWSHEWIGIHEDAPPPLLHDPDAD